MALIQITDLTFAYPGSFDNVFEHVSFQLDTNWRLGLTGRNGRGKTTLLRLLQGQYPHQGTITSPGGFAYFPYPIPDAALTPLELLERSFPDVPEWRFRRELAPLAVADDVLYRPFSTLSGGEQAKLLLALLFARRGGICSSMSRRTIWTRRAARSSAGIWRKSPAFCSSRTTARFWTAASTTSCP